MLNFASLNCAVSDVTGGGRMRLSGWCSTVPVRLVFGLGSLGVNGPISPGKIVPVRVTAGGGSGKLAGASRWAQGKTISNSPVMSTGTVLGGVDVQCPPCGRCGMRARMGAVACRKTGPAVGL